MGRNWQNYIFLIVVFGLPALSWIASRIKEGADARKARMSRERNRNKALRSTPTIVERPHHANPVASRADVALQRSRAEALRRQGELEAIRQRRLAELQARTMQTLRQTPNRPAPQQSARQPVRQPRTRQAPPLRTPGASGRATRASSGLSAHPQQSHARTSTRSTQKQRSKQSNARRSEIARAREKASKPAKKSLAEQLKTGDPLGALAKKPRMRPAPARSPRFSAADLRKVVILREVLDPPVALRCDF